MKKNRIITGAALAGAAMLTLGACSAADVAEQNNRAAANNFEIQRRIVFVNGITDKYLLEIEGRCSVTDETGESGASQLEVICKTGEDEYKKHLLGLSDNVTYFAEQLESNKSDSFHYTVRLRPETIVPDVKVDTSKGEVG